MRMFGHFVNSPSILVITADTNQASAHARANNHVLDRLWIVRGANIP